MSEGPVVGNAAVDFVVRRKRKRQAMEPSTDFYDFSGTVSTELARHHLPAHMPWNVNLLCPTLAPAADSLNPSDPPTGMEVSSNHDEHPSGGSYILSPIVTIEEFLRRPARLLKPTRNARYGRQNTRTLNHAQIAIIDSSELEDDSDNVIQLRSRRIIKHQYHEAEPDTGKAYSLLEQKQRIPKKKKAKSLAERLFSAAVLSNGDPINTLVQPRSDFSRQPLRFIPDNDVTSHLSATKRRSWSIVDPRRAVPACPASFLHSNSRSTGNSRPLTQTLQLQNNATSLTGGKRLSTRLNVRFTTERLPLLFVPMTEAEVNNKGRRLLQDKEATGTSQIIYPQGAVCASRSLTVRGPEQTVSSTDSCTVTPTPWPATASASSFSTALHQNASCLCLSSPLLQNGSPLQSSMHLTLLNNTCSSRNDTISSAPCSDRSLLDDSPLTAPEKAETLKTKTLRPLASLLDQLRQTARDAEIQASYKSKRNFKPSSQVNLPKKKELQATRNTSSATSIKSIKPFIRASVRGLISSSTSNAEYDLTTHSRSLVQISQASSDSISHTYPPLPSHSFLNSCEFHGSDDILEWNPLSSPLEDIRHDLDLVNDLKMIRRSRNRQSSPDILSALAPHPYQVVLTSSLSAPSRTPI